MWEKQSSVMFVQLGSFHTPEIPGTVEEECQGWDVQMDRDRAGKVGILHGGIFPKLIPEGTGYVCRSCSSYSLFPFPIPRGARGMIPASQESVHSGSVSALSRCWVPPRAGHGDTSRCHKPGLVPSACSCRQHGNTRGSQMLWSRNSKVCAGNSALLREKEMPDRVLLHPRETGLSSPFPGDFGIRP